jgi:prophage regulatory protein
MSAQPLKPTAVVAIEPAFLAKSEAAVYLSVSTTTLDSLVSSGELPRPRKISSNRVAFLVDDLRSFARSRPVSDLLPPRNSGYGRAGSIRGGAL